MYVNLVLNDIAAAQQHAARLRPIMEHRIGFLGGHYHFIMTWLTINVGDLKQASQHSERALQEVTKLKTPYPLGECELATAHVKYEMGKHERAWAHVARAKECSDLTQSPLLKFKCLLTEAYFLLTSRRQEEATKPLREAMEVGHAYNQTVTSFWRPKVMALLCAEALKRDIEVTYVQNLIRARNLVPDELLLGIPNWPWAVRVTTLGKFEMEVNDQPIAFGRKVPRRVLALLQAVIAFGGKDIPELKLMDALWPEADGDRAYRSYATALHRLRKILGEEKTIIVKDSKVTLNPLLCWVDVWAFEHWLHQADDAKRESDMVKRLVCSKQALRLYHGPFLHDALQQPWASRLRTRLHKQHEALLASLPEARELNNTAGTGRLGSAEQADWEPVDG